MKAQVQGRTDTVIAADLSDEEWLELRREHDSVRHLRRRADLLQCVDCLHPMFPKQNYRGTRFFAHTPDSPDTCPLKACDGESQEHRRMKVAIYKAARRVRGWSADLEVKAPDVHPVTGRPVVVDVVAQRQSGAATPVTGALQGWEVQLSREDEGQVLNRQDCPGALARPLHLGYTPAAGLG